DQLFREGGPDGTRVLLLPVLQRLEHLDLSAVVVGDGERLEAFERDAPLAVLLEKPRRDAGKLHPLEDMAFIDAESLAYASGGFAVFDECRERFKLVCRVHGQPDGILGKAHLQSVLVCHDMTGNREILRQLALRLKRANRLQTAATSNDAESSVACIGD